jgi:polysaccharide biosynthesis transport protein
MNSPDPAAGRSATLAATLRTLAERWWVLLACLVIGAGLAYGIDKRKTKLYAATAILQLGSTGSNISGVINPNASTSSADPQREQGTTLMLVASTAVAERVRTTLRLEEAAADLSAQMTVSAEPDTNLIDVGALDADPTRAARLANAFAEQYQALRRERVRQVYAQSIQDLEQQRNALPIGAVRQRADLTTTLLQLRTIQATTSGGVEVAGQATPPTVAAKPRPKRDAAIGGILGLAFGATLVFALDLLDRRLKGRESFEKAYDIPITASIPLRRGEPRTERDRIVALEPYRILRSGVHMIGGSGASHTVLVTSAIPGEGKSTVAAGLAGATAFAGQRVVLVELDLRRPTFHERFPLDRKDRGLTDLLLGEATLDEVLREVPETDGLCVLPAGAVPERSSEMLDSPKMRKVLGDLAARFDAVVLDAPPLLPVADARVMLDAPQIDVVLVVGRSHVTGRDQAQQTRAILDQYRVPRLGLVVNGMRSGDQRYEYGYET